MVASRRTQGSPVIDDNLNLHGFSTETARGLYYAIRSSILAKAYLHIRNQIHQKCLSLAAAAIGLSFERWHATQLVMNF